PLSTVDPALHQGCVVRGVVTDPRAEDIIGSSPGHIRPLSDQPAAASSASRRAMMSLYCASVPNPSAPSAPGSPLSPLAPLAPSAPGVPGSPLSPLGPCGPCAALAAPAASIRLSSAAVIGVPPAAPSAHLSGSKAIRHHL